jgi:hypothetical protein
MRGVRGSLFVAGCELGGGFAAGLGGIFTGFRRLLAHLSGVVDLAGAAGQGDVGTAFGEEGLLLLAEVADDLGGMAHSAHATGVGGGEIEALNESEGAPFGDAVGGEGVDDAGDGDLDGLAVLKLGELDVRAGIDAVGIKVGFVAIAVVAAMKAIVEVAEDRSAEGDGAALEAVGLDVAADVDLHECSFETRTGRVGGGGGGGGGWGGGGVVKWRVCFDLAKCVPVKIRNEMGYCKNKKTDGLWARARRKRRLNAKPRRMAGAWGSSFLVYTSSIAR